MCPPTLRAKTGREQVQQNSGLFDHLGGDREDIGSQIKPTCHRSLSCRVIMSLRKNLMNAKTTIVWSGGSLHTWVDLGAISWPAGLYTHERRGYLGGLAIQVLWIHRMKYGVIADNFLEFFALLSGKIPTPALDLFLGIMKTRLIMTGVRLGVFDALMAGPATAIDVGGQLCLNVEALDMLLRALVIFDYLTFHRGRFRLTKLGRLVASSSSRNFVGYVMLSFKQWEMMDYMEELVRTGRGIELHRNLDDAQDWRNYHKAMLEIARIEADLIAAKVPVPMGARRLLDAGGSHGLYAAAICRKRPPMSAVVLELPAGLEHARELARREGIDDLVEHRGGDIIRDDLGSGYDTVLLSNILHHFQPDDILTILGKTNKALRNSGTVAIWEFEAPSRGGHPNIMDVAALFFRLTSTAALYDVRDYAGWLKTAGFRHVKVVRPRLAPGRALITGVVVSDLPQS